MSLESFPPAHGAYSRVVGTTADPTTTSATFVLLPEMTKTLTTHGRRVRVALVSSVSRVASVLAGDAFQVALFLDDVELTDTRQTVSVASGLTFSDVVIVSTETEVALAAGSHTFEARYRRPSGTGTARAYSTERRLTISEGY